MIHAQVVRTVIGYAVTYAPRVYRAYKAGSYVRTIRSEHRQNTDSFRPIKSGTVPTIKEWWQ